MPFALVGGVGRGMDVLHGGKDRPREGTLLREYVGHHIVTNMDFVA